MAKRSVIKRKRSKPASTPRQSFPLFSSLKEVRKCLRASLAATKTAPRYILRDVKINSISAVGPDFKPTMRERRRPGRGAPRKIDLIAFQDDVNKHPSDSIRSRAKRLDVSRDTIRHLLKRLKEPHDVEFSIRGGPIILMK